MNPAIVAALDAFVAEIQRPMFEQLQKLEEKVQNTLENVKPILENMDGRLISVEKSLDNVTTASDEQIATVVNSIIDDKIETALKESDDVMSYSDVEELIDEKISNIEYDDHVSDALGNINLAEQISRRDLKEAISELTFTVEVS